MLLDMKKVHAVAGTSKDRLIGFACDVMSLSPLQTLGSVVSCPVIHVHQRSRHLGLDRILLYHL